MVDYKKLYHWMVNAAEDAIGAIEAGNIQEAKQILIRAQQCSEEEYIRSEKG